jgi:hypothetical protein
VHRVVEQGSADAHASYVGMHEKVDDEGPVQLGVPNRLTYHQDRTDGSVLEGGDPGEIVAQCAELSSEGVVHLLPGVVQAGGRDTWRVCREIGGGEGVAIRGLDASELDGVDVGGSGCATGK